MVVVIYVARTEQVEGGSGIRAHTFAAQVLPPADPAFVTLGPLRRGSSHLMALR